MEYGYKLQKYLLDRYRIIALFESVSEPWFVGARVATCATILEKEDDPQKRDNNIVRFVQLRADIATIINEEDDARRFKAFNDFHARILSVTTNYADAQIRVRLIKQSELFRLGCRVALSATDAIDSDEDESNEEKEEASEAEPVLGTGPQRKYFGSKWGIHLRAPDFFFEIEEQFAARLCPLADVADVKYGLKTGADDFFYVFDITATDEVRNMSDTQLRNKFGVQKRQLSSKRIVRSSDGHVCVLERSVLKPVIMSIMGIESLELHASDAQRFLFSTNRSCDQLKGTFAEKYIRHGERQGYHERPFVKSRTKTTGYWYDVGSYTIGDVLWAKAHQYRHAAPSNPDGLICNCRMYAISAFGRERRELLAAVLNTTYTAFNKEFYGRILGREGNTDTMVGDCKLMMTVRLDSVPQAAATRLIAAYAQLAKRKTLPFFPMGDELEQVDRHELDDAVFECLGVADVASQRALREKLYHEMRVLHSDKRSLELLAIENRRRTSRGGEPTPEDIANEIWGECDQTDISLFPDDFQGDYESLRTEPYDIPAGQRIVLGASMFDMSEQIEEPQPKHVRTGTVLVDRTLHDFGSDNRARYAAACLMGGIRGRIDVPLDDAIW